MFRNTLRYRPAYALASQGPYLVADTDDADNNFRLWDVEKSLYGFCITDAHHKGIKPKIPCL